MRQIMCPLQYKRGFTLIELLIVFSVIAIISTVTLASLGDFNKNNSIKQNAAQLASTLNDAKSRASSQVKPTGATCSGDLSGYTVDFCLTTNASCSKVDTYVLSVICGGTKRAIVTKSLPSAVHFTSAGTTSSSYTFPVLTGGASGSGSVVISGYGATATIVVSPAGAISVQ